MDIFNNCRLCLQSINHEPIRITRSLLRFLKDDLRMENIVRQSGPANGKQQKLCASCFNKLSEFQDFLEQCREADDFWKNQFSRDESSNAQQEQPKENEDNYICVSDVSSSKPTETKLETEFQEDDEDDELLLSLAVPDDDGMEQQNTGHIENETTCDEDEIHVDAFDAPDQEDEWPEDENESIMDLENVSSAPDKFVPDQEIIQYEYELPKENSEGNEFLANSRQITITDEEETETTETQTQTFSYEDVEGDDDSCTLLQESINDMLRSTSSNSETTLERTAASSSTYILTTVLDDNGKVKKSYQCQHCGKCMKTY